jgi:hypothetical protein
MPTSLRMTECERTQPEPSHGTVAAWTPGGFELVKGVELKMLDGGDDWRTVATARTDDQGKYELSFLPRFPDCPDYPYWKLFLDGHGTRHQGGYLEPAPEPLCGCGVYWMLSKRSPPSHWWLAKTADCRGDFCDIRALSLNVVLEFARALGAINALYQQNPYLKRKIQQDADANGSQTGRAPAGTWIRTDPANAAKAIDQRDPQIAVAIRSAGLTTEEFQKLSVTLPLFMAEVGEKPSGRIHEYPPGMISAKNAAFLELNHDTINAIIGPPIAQAHLN